MRDLPAFSALVDSFSRLPGVGGKTAERMAYAVLEMREEDALNFAKSVEEAKTLIHKCPRCGLYAQDDVCDICADGSRDHTQCVVVSLPKDALAFERLQGFNGIYHVLGGVLSPSKGIGVGELSIDKLIERVETEGIKEVIIATSPTLEGETTAMFISKLLEGKDVSVTRLAYGLPMGASLDYADSLTLSRALEGRRKI